MLIERYLEVQENIQKIESLSSNVRVSVSLFHCTGGVRDFFLPKLSFSNWANSVSKSSYPSVVCCVFNCITFFPKIFFHRLVSLGLVALVPYPLPTSSPSQNLVWEVKFGQELSTTTQKLKLLLPKPLEGSQCCVEDIVLTSDHRVSYFLLFHGSTEKKQSLWAQ